MTIPSDDEDDDIQIISVSKRHRRKRRKPLESKKGGAELGVGGQNNSQALRQTSVTGIGLVATPKDTERARSAELPALTTNNEPAAERSRSVPQELTKSTPIPVTLPRRHIAESPTSKDISPSTPGHQSSSYLRDPAVSTGRQAYPTPKTSTNGGCGLVKILSSSPLGDRTDTSSITAGGKLPTSARQTPPQTPPGHVSSRVFPNPFARSKRPETSNPSTKKIAQARQGSLDSLIKRSDKSSASKEKAKPTPQKTASADIQQRDIGNLTPRANGPSEHSSESKKRKWHSSFSEQTISQPPVRNRILWSIPAFKPMDKDLGELSPQNMIAKQPIDSTTTMGLSTHAVPQEAKTPKTRKAWTSKMYADLAQQLQQCFPFAEFAKQHSRSENEVFDVFSAIVHLPLLQKSSLGLSRLSGSGHQSTKALKHLMKETKSALAQETEHQRKQGAVRPKTTAENKAVAQLNPKHSRKSLLDLAHRAKSSADAHELSGTKNV